MANFTQLPSGNWRVQVRRKNRYVSETFRRHKDGEDWALDMERNIDRSGSPKPRAAVQAKTFGDIIDLHIEDMHEVGRPPRRSKAAVLEALKEALGTVKLPKLNRERLIEFGRQRAKEGAGPATLAIDFSFSRPGMLRFRAFMAKYYPEANRSESGPMIAFIAANALVEVLKRCGDDLTRDNVMKMVANLDLEIDGLIPGIRVKTTETDFYPVEQVQMMRFTGERWEAFGPILDGRDGTIVPSPN
ncbi:hypothetical protein [Bradyrhizobium japonicum]|uniref:hypothetical protein n=1 Tax=Bradyrhizobium japonicum TaxID=375 RepID=UPI00339183E4